MLPYWIGHRSYSDQADCRVRSLTSHLSDVTGTGPAMKPSSGAPREKPKAEYSMCPTKYLMSLLHACTTTDEASLTYTCTPAIQATCSPPFDARLRASLANKSPIVPSSLITRAGECQRSRSRIGLKRLLRLQQRLGPIRSMH